ncbi:ABC transporter ATP-binding protein, partial [Candidatus Saccharibacteria bacterium]|nr:ABC transporter ATP-binding protein [Candidatus Saccharibacteria bacterium]
MLSFFRYLKPYWAQAILLVVAIGLQVWGTLALPALMADIVNDSIATKNTSQIWNIGLMMFGFTIMAAVCACLSSFFSARIGAALSRDIRQDVYRKILSLSISEIDNFSTASLITRTTNDIAQVQQTLIMSLSMLLRAPIMAIGAIIGAIDTAPDMTWIIVLAVGVMLVCIITVMAIVIPKFELFQKLIDKITLITRENLTGIRVVRAFNNQKLEYKKFKKANDEITDVNIFINNLMSLEAPLMTLVFNGTSILCVWIGISLLEKDISYLGDMMAFMQYALQVIMAFLVLTIFFVMLPRANVSARRIHEVLDIKPTIHWRKKTEGTPSLTPSVEFKDVTFSYPSAEAPVLNNISFAAKAGETTAFIGSTGSGKTTLINLVPRFHDATSGEVIIDGLNVKKYSKDDLMQKIGYV